MHGSVGRYLKKKQGSTLPCFYYFKLPSTNDTAKELLKSGKITDKAVIVAGKQTSGRGRYNRKFLSPRGGAYLSFVTPMDSLSHAPALGLYAALAVCEVLKSSEFLPDADNGKLADTVAIKWPNDVKLNGKKLVGILPESTEIDGKTYAIIGVGVNVNATEKQLGELSSLATSMRIESGSRFPEARFAAALASALDKITERYLRGDATLIGSYCKLCETIGKTVRYTGADGNHQIGKAIEISENGSLVLERGNTVEKIGWGEITEEI